MSKPFLKWAGGKSKLVPFIQTFLPKNQQRRLVEPFAGSASLSLGLEFDEYWINDSNADLINLYQILANEKIEFIDYAESFFIPENNQETAFYHWRERFNHSVDLTEKSALFIYLNRHAFNGLCRYNSKGGFNVPFGRYKSPYFPKAEMLAFVAKSPRMRFFNEDFSQILLKTSLDDVVYCDPPYVPMSETASFTSYTKQGFDIDEQLKLSNLANNHATKTQGILISNHDTPVTRKLYQNAQIQTVQVQRNIAAKGDSRKKVAELLAIYDKDVI